MRKLLKWLLGTCVPCLGWHLDLSQPRRDEKGVDYQRCLDCGKRLPCLQFGDWRPELERPSAIDREALVEAVTPDDEEETPAGVQWVNGGIRRDMIGSGAKDSVQ